MARDSSRTHLHLHAAFHADLLEEFTRLPLLPDEIYIAPEYQPTNPEDEDDVVPDQHAAFGIRQATAEKKEPIWRDLRLEELLNDTARMIIHTGPGNRNAGPSAELASAGEQPGDVLRRRRTAAQGRNANTGADARS